MSRFFPSSASSLFTDKVLDGLQTVKLTRLRLERLPRGADGAYIDVSLGPALKDAVGVLIGALVRETAQKLWCETSPALSDSVVGDFRAQVEAHHKSAIGVAREGRRIEYVQLFETALLKLILATVDQQLDALRQELDELGQQPARRASGQSMQLHHRAALLGRQAGHVRFQVARRVVRELMRLEHSNLKNLRHSVLGVGWPVPATMISNPLLQLCGGGSLRDFVRNYPAALYDKGCACRISDCVIDALRTGLPDCVELTPAQSAPQASLQQARLRQAGGPCGVADIVQRLRGLVGEAELNDSAPLWIDVPDNAAMLLGGVDKDWPASGAWHKGVSDRLQRALNKRLAARLSRAGLMKHVLASYELDAVYPWLGLVDAEALVYDYLKGGLSGRELQRRLASTDAVEDPARVVRRIEELRRQHKKDPVFGKRQNVARIAVDVLRLRRDLKQGLRFMQAMDEVRLASGPPDTDPAQASDGLQQFGASQPGAEVAHDVTGHAVVHVDIRGTDEIAARMRRQNLNPAAQFSSLFYDPLNHILQRFGAEKAVVEGGALTLSILALDGSDGESLAVSRACRTASCVLDQVETLNNELARMGLPLLEAGIGIAYADEPPTYLYDHSRRVLLSPTIGPAKRMAGCDSGLRRDCPLPSGRRLCVVTPVRGAGDGEADGDALIRCNVYGVELDPAAFAQLNVEISLRKLKMRDKRSGQAVILYAGHCMDTQGDSHVLLVREHPVKLLVGRRLLQTGGQERRYYEVVVDSDLLAMVERRLVAVEKQRNETASGVRN